MNAPVYKKCQHKKGFYFAFLFDCVQEGISGYDEYFDSAEQIDTCLELVRLFCTDRKNYELLPDKGFGLQFLLNSEDGSIIYTSRFYSNEVALEKGINLLMEFGQTANVIVRDHEHA